MTCPVCCRAPADKYLWCEKCLKRAARGAARYFLGLTGRQPQPGHVAACLDDPDQLGLLIRREANRWERRFKRRLLRR